MTPNLLAYGPDALRTAPPIGITHLAMQSKCSVYLLHSVLGLISDLEELKKPEGAVNEIAELGDCMWFLNVGYAAFGWPINALALESNALFSLPSENQWTKYGVVTRLIELAAQFADRLKAHLYYGKTEWDAEKEGLSDWAPTPKLDLEGVMLMSLNAIASGLGFYCRQFMECPVQVILDGNIAKLKERFGEKFSQHAALNRDTAREDAGVAQIAGLVPEGGALGSAVSTAFPPGSVGVVGAAQMLGVKGFTPYKPFGDHPDPVAEAKLRFQEDLAIEKARQDLETKCEAPHDAGDLSKTGCGSAHAQFDPNQLERLLRFGANLDLAYIKSQLETTHEVDFKLFTPRHEYSLRLVTPGPTMCEHGYIGCTVTNLLPLEGEDYRRGNDLHDGPYTPGTWNNVLADILAYELRP